MMYYSRCPACGFPVQSQGHKFCPRCGHEYYPAKKETDTDKSMRLMRYSEKIADEMKAQDFMVTRVEIITTFMGDDGRLMHIRSQRPKPE